jgi:hypothetical protein
MTYVERWSSSFHRVSNAQDHGSPSLLVKKLGAGAKMAMAETLKSVLSKAAKRTVFPGHQRLQKLLQNGLHDADPRVQRLTGNGLGRMTETNRRRLRNTIYPNGESP